MFEAEIRQNEH